MPSENTILHSLRKTGIPVHTECESGICGACRTRIIEGEVEYIFDPLAFIGYDEVLPCVCKPTSLVRLALS